MAQENNYNTKNNPKEFAYNVTNKTLAFENNFTQATFDNGSYPLEIYDSTFSRISGVLINEDKKVATFNIPKADLPALFKKSDFACNKELDYRINTESNSSNMPSSLAYTVRITGGKLKGKTPAEALIEDASNKDILNEQYIFLKKNIQKYPKNKEQMEAISEAAKLFEEGKLNAANVTKEIVIPIYNPGVRPKIRKIREDGKAFVYDVKINWHLGSASPVIIEVSNYYAPVIQKEDGLLNVKVSEKDADSEIKGSKSLSLEAWEDIVYNMKMQMRAFEINHFASALKMANQQDQKNRQPFQ